MQPAAAPTQTAQTFLFADLSGFTALTEAHGDQQAADVVAEFCAAVRGLLAEHQAHEVKSIGDALMLRTADAAAAVRLGLRIVGEVGAQHRFPLVRVGMHTGSAVERDGDWFGAAVNLAARVSGAACGGQVLLTAATRAAAGKVEGVELRTCGHWAFRNVSEPVEVYAAVQRAPRNPAGLPVDPVCRMAVDPSHAAGRLTYQGVQYCFCSRTCADAFMQRPSTDTTTQDQPPRQ